jgi:uncharacterized membrane protein
MSLHIYRDKEGKEVVDANELFDTIREGDKICQKAMLKAMLIVLPLMYLIENYIIPWFKGG